VAVSKVVVAAAFIDIALEHIFKEEVLKSL
jgi:hypothetical protein